MENKDMIILQPQEIENVNGGIFPAVAAFLFMEVSITAGGIANAAAIGAFIGGAIGTGIAIYNK